MHREDRSAVLFAELSELAGQRNAIDGRIVEIVAEMEREELCGATGARSIAQLVAWKLGCSSANARTFTTVAQRVQEFPRCARGLREGRLSLDQVGVIAARAGAGSDEHYEQLARSATVNQLRTAVSLKPRPAPDDSRPATPPSIAKTGGEDSTCWRIRLSPLDAARFEAALAAHRDALVAEWKHDRGASQGPSENAPPMPGTLEAFMRLVEAGWDVEATRRPHGQHTTVVMHLDMEKRAAALHLGPALTEAERHYLSCDATYEVWFERDGQPIGAGRTTRAISRRLRRALEHRHPTCAVPGCGATRGLHAHHLRHWEDGGATEPANLKYVCHSGESAGRGRWDATEQDQGPNTSLTYPHPVDRAGERAPPVSIVVESGRRDPANSRPVDGVFIAEPDSYDMAGVFVDLSVNQTESLRPPA